MDKMKSVAAKAVKGHEKRMHGMKAGGVTSAMAAKYGRNMARVMNQRSQTKPGRG
jgi:hypothetical protein